MENPTLVLTKQDRMILESMKTVADGLANYLGNGYEIVLYSLEFFDHSVIKIFNGHYTGQRIGSPMTDLALSMLSNIEETGGCDFLSYTTKSKSGEPLKATTIAIRGEANQIIGLLCIHFYLSTPLSTMIHNLVEKESGRGRDNISENYTGNTDELILSSLAAAKDIIYNDSTISTSNKNKEIIAILYQKGIFNMKDSVVKIAKLLNISKNTVYMHMRNLNHKN